MNVSRSLIALLPWLVRPHGFHTGELSPSRDRVPARAYAALHRGHADGGPRGDPERRGCRPARLQRAAGDHPGRCRKEPGSTSSASMQVEISRIGAAQSVPHEAERAEFAEGCAAVTSSRLIEVSSAAAAASMASMISFSASRPRCTRPTVSSRSNTAERRAVGSAGMILVNCSACAPTTSPSLSCPRHAMTRA